MPLCSDPNEHPPRGTHALVDGENADPIALNNVKLLRYYLVDALVDIGATVMQVIEQQFEPQGCSVLAVLAESHASIHTYPEAGVFMIDVFTCGDLDAELCAQEIARRVGGRFTARTLRRGRWESREPKPSDPGRRVPHHGSGP